MSVIQATGFPQDNFLFSREGRSYQVFQQTEMKVSVVFQQYRMVAGSIIETVRLRGKEFSSRPWNLFSRSFFSQLVDHYTAYGKYAAKTDPDFGPIKNIVSLSGVSLDVYLQSIETASQIAHSFFDRDVIFPQFAPTELIDRWADEASVLTVRYLRESLGYKRVDWPFVFKESDLAKFGVSSSFVTLKPGDLSCYAYALFHVGEVDAAPLIFKKDRASELHDLFNLLTKWNYFSVHKPDKGDLVVYLGDDGVARHMAVFVEGDIVASKPGDQSPYVYTHPIFQVGFEYGNKVIFFRKGPSLS